MPKQNEDEDVSLITSQKEEIVLQSDSTEKSAAPKVSSKFQNCF